MTCIYGHRGARGEAPENTLCAFQRCLDDGVSRCELDLHLSADGELMVIHDPTLMRTTGQIGLVSDHSASWIEQLDARRNTSPWSAPCTVPRLRTLFEQCHFEHWQLEVKTASPTQASRIVEALVLLLDEFQLQQQVTVTSSSLTVLRTLQALAPDLSRGLVAERSIPEPVVQAQRYGCQMLVLHWKLCTPKRLARASDAGILVSAWTVNDAQKMRRLVADGVHSLITDFPALAISTLQEQGRDRGEACQDRQRLLP